MRMWCAAALFGLAAASPQERPHFSAESSLVVLHAMVEDRRGAPVSDLTADNFLVYEDNRPQELAFFARADAPASIGLLIDNSTSMIPLRERVVAAAVTFAELSNPDDEVFVLAFNEHVRVVWAPRVLRESDLLDLRRTLAAGILARGRTALYDAIAGGLDRLRHARHSRQVLVLVSDGSDNASRATLDATVERLQAANAMIYSVGLKDDLSRDGNPRLLRRLSTMTGGEMFRPDRLDEVPEALEHIARDIRATYTLGYAPLNQARDGQVRRLRVVARHPDGRTLKVQTRGGYIAPRPKPSGTGEDRR